MYFHDFSKNISDLENEEPIIECRKQIALDELALPGWDIIFDYKVPTMKFLGSGPAVNINASRDVHILVFIIVRIHCNKEKIKIKYQRD